MSRTRKTEHRLSSSDKQLQSKDRAAKRGRKRRRDIAHAMESDEEEASSDGELSLSVR